jgi:glutamyl/glutaminyl-tRNA synthetase
LSELVAEFSLEKVNKSGAIFDVIKLDFLNRQWRKKLGIRAGEDPLFKRTAALLSEKLGSVDQKILEAVWPQILERIQGPSAAEDIGEFSFYFHTPAYAADLLIWKDTPRESVRKNLKLLKEFLTGFKSEEFEQVALEAKTKAFLQEQGIGLGEGLWPLRVALSGQKNSPGPFEIMHVFGKLLERPEEIFARIEAAIKLLSESPPTESAASLGSS